VHHQLSINGNLYFKLSASVSSAASPVLLQDTADTMEDAQVLIIQTFTNVLSVHEVKHEVPLCAKQVV